LFEKVEKLLKAEAERHLNASSDASNDRQFSQDVQYATPNNFLLGQDQARLDLLSDSSLENIN